LFSSPSQKIKTPLTPGDWKIIACLFDILSKTVMEDGDFDFEVLQLTLSIHGCHGGSIITQIDLRGY